MEIGVINALAKAIGIYSICIIVIGTLGNLSGAIVCSRKSLRQTPTFIFIGFALVSDILSMYWWNIDHFLQAFQFYQLEDISVNFCRLVTFFQAFSLQWSAWLLVS